MVQAMEAKGVESVFNPVSSCKLSAIFIGIGFFIYFKKHQIIGAI